MRKLLLIEGLWFYPGVDLRMNSAGRGTCFCFFPFQLLYTTSLSEDYKSLLHEFISQARMWRYSSCDKSISCSKSRGESEKDLSACLLIRTQTFFALTSRLIFKEFYYYFCCIFRKFKSLGSSGFSLRKQDYYTPFQCTFTRKKMTTREVTQMGTYPSWYESTSTSVNSGSPDAIQMTSESSSLGSQGEAKCTEDRKLYTIMYCVPLMSPYSGKC